MSADDVLGGLARALAPYVAAELAKMPRLREARPYSQHDGERPPGCSRTTFLRAWRVAHRSGHPGATCDGRARLLTPEAFAVGRAGMRPKATPAEPACQDAGVLEELGLVARSAA